MTPQGLLQIFRQNIVRVHTLTSRLMGVDYVTIDACQGVIGEVGHWGSGTPCGVMIINEADQHDPGAFDTWICDYAANEIRYRTLTNQHDYCFTTNMNGCTFGIGTPVQGGVVVVSHANADTLGGGNMTQQANEQKAMTSAIIPDGVRMLQPKDYGFSGASNYMGKTGVSKLNTTTFGVLLNGAWTFYYQQYRQEGRRFLLVTFRQIDVNSMTTFISD